MLIIVSCKLIQAEPKENDAPMASPASDEFHSPAEEVKKDAKKDSGSSGISFVENLKKVCHLFFTKSDLNTTYDTHVIETTQIWS